MRLVLVVLSLFLVAASAPAEQPTPQGIPAPLPAATPPAETTTPPAFDASSTPIDLMARGDEALDAAERTRRTQLSAAMHQELADLYEHSFAQVLELNARAEKASDAEAQLQVQQEIAQIKMGEQIQSLLIQARYAREIGSAELAAEIDAAVAFLKDPVVETASEDRAPRPRAER